MAKLTPMGPAHVEHNDGSQMVQKTGLRISTNDRIRSIIRHELFQQQANKEAETFEEADDFDLPDGEEWISPYEEQFEPDPTPPADPSGSVQDNTKPAVTDPPEPVPSDRGDALPNGSSS